jgi:hypothetical protein
MYVPKVAGGKSAAMHQGRLEDAAGNRQGAMQRGSARQLQGGGDALTQYR